MLWLIKISNNAASRPSPAPVRRTVAAMPIKLTYFNIEAAAEKVRLALVLTGTEFEDNRINFPDWEAMKPSTPYGQLPIMEIDGKVMTQSYAMLRYVGKTMGGGKLYPDDKFFDIEETIGLHEDLARAWSPAMYVGMRPANLGYEFANDDEKKAKTQSMREKFAKDDLPKFLGFLSQKLEKTGAFFCGSEVTIADLAILPQIRYFKKGVADYVDPTIVDQFPVVNAWVDRMLAIPELAKWYEAK